MTKLHNTCTIHSEKRQYAVTVIYLVASSVQQKPLLKLTTMLYS